MATRAKVGPVKPPDGAMLLKLEEVAYELRISVTSVRRLVAKGRLKSIPVTVSGAAVRVLRETLDDYLRSAEQGASSHHDGETGSPAMKTYSMAKAGWDGKNRLPLERSRKPKKV